MKTPPDYELLFMASPLRSIMCQALPGIAKAFEHWPFPSPFPEVPTVQLPTAILIGNGLNPGPVLMTENKGGKSLWGVLLDLYKFARPSKKCSVHEFIKGNHIMMFQVIRN